MERAVISTLLCGIDPVAWPGMIGKLDESFFDDPRHKQMFMVIKKHPRAMNHHEFTDACSNFLQEMGGPDYILNTIQFAPILGRFDDYVETLGTFAMRRGMSQLAQKVNLMAYDMDTLPIDSLSELNGQIAAIMAKTCPSEFITAGQAAEMELNRVPSKGATTGLQAFDDILGGIARGEVCVIAARPGRGKTVLGIQVGLRAAGDNGKGLLISMEMSAFEIGRRMMANFANVFQNKIKKKEYSDYDYGLLIQSVGRLHQLNFDIVDKPMTMNKLSQTIRAKKMTGGLDVVVIDYLGLIRRPASKKSTADEIALITGEIKSLARELDIAVVLLAQLNREGANEKPTLANLRDSGAIEQDADKVIFIYPKDKSQEESKIPCPFMWLDVAKNRQGEAARVLVRFNKPMARFEEIRQGEQYD